MRAPILVCVLSGLFAANALPRAAAAQQQPARGQQNLVELGRQQYDDLRYDEAIQTLSAAIIRRGNTRAAEIQAYELLGLSYLALNRNDEAEGAFRQVLNRNPAYSLSNELAPRTLEFFAAARQRWEGEGRPGLLRDGPEASAPVRQAQAVTIEHRSPAQQERGRPVPLAATVVDPGNRVARLVLAYRASSRGVFRRVDAQAAGRGQYRALLPGDVVRPPLVEYYLEAVDGSGIPVQSRGDAYAPLRVAVPEPGGVPWWVFVGGGVLVAGAVVATVLVVTSQTAPAQLTISVMGE